MKEILFAGLGGQGILTSGLVISQIAVSKDLNATWIPQYGAAMRGGTANCTVKFGNDMVYNPGTVVIDSGLVTCDTDVRDDITVIGVPSSEMAIEMGHAKGANIIMVGVIAKVSGDITEEDGISGMNEMFRKKGKSKFEELNTKAFKLGYNFKK